MSTERVTVRLNHEGYFHTPGVSKRTYRHEMTGGDGIQVLSTNDIDNRQVVRLSSSTPLDENEITFEVPGEHVAQVLCEACPQGIYEFVITTQEVIEKEEDEAHTKRRSDLKRAAPLLRHQKAKRYFSTLEKTDPRVAEYYQQQEEKERQEASLTLTEDERELAPEARTEDLDEVPVVSLERRTFPGQVKSDALKVVLRSPFGDSDTAQLRVTTAFAYARKRSGELLPDKTHETKTYAHGAIPALGEISVETEVYFYSKARFELTIILEDIRTGRSMQRIISSEEFGDPQVVLKDEEQGTPGSKTDYIYIAL